VTRRVRGVGRPVLVLALLLLISLPACGTTSPTSNVPSALLTVYHRLTDVREAGQSPFLPGYDREPLVPNDTVRTDSTGFAEIDYPDGSLTRLDVNTVFSVTQLVNTPERRAVSAQLDVGRSWNRVVEITGSGGFSVSTPDATATVRGTVFVVACDPSRTCQFVVFEGSLQVRTVSGTVVVIRATRGHGQEVDVAADGTPTTPFPASPIDSDPWLETNARLDSGATPSPSGSPSPPALPGTIVFLSNPHQAEPALLNEIDEMNPDGTGIRRLPLGNALCCGAPALSPDGTRLVFTGEGTLDVADADGRHVQSLVPPTGVGGYFFPTWSPSGDRIAFIYDAGSGQSPEIDIVDADGNDRHRVVQSPEVSLQGDLAWSPDGTELAFGTTPKGSPIPSADIDVIPTSGGTPHPFVTGVLEGVAALSWAPGSDLLFAPLHEAVIWEADATGLGHPVDSLSPSGGLDSSPSWGPDGVHFSFIRDGGVVIATVDQGVLDGVGPRGVSYAQWGGPPG
jgi:Tol biopolymer transport system component